MIRIAPRHPRGGTFLAQSLERLGVRHVISLPGSQMLAAWDAIATCAGLQLVVPRSEAVGAMMANAYGLACGRPCVVMNTLGPGVANELPALHDAWRGESPVVFISPMHPRAKRAHLETVFQGFDQSAFLAPYAKETIGVDAAADLGAALQRAVALSTTPPMGPVRIDVSFPLLFERHDFGAVPVVRREPPPRGRTIAVAAASRAIERYVDVDGADRLWPVTGGEDEAVAFAVGASLAHGGATALVTTVDVVLRNAHALSLPSRDMPSTRLVSIASSCDAELARLAHSIGAVLERGEKRGPVQPDPGQLTIVALPTASALPPS